MGHGALVAGWAKETPEKKIIRIKDMISFFIFSAGP